jgi:arsenite methyltransferase
MKSVEFAVRERYSAGAQRVEAALCCPVEYDPKYLEPIAAEVLERDYGCGDPTRHLRPGETVLDLGCGGGKVCYIAAQVVGPGGRVIGVDCNRDMLALARRHQAEFARRVGYDNIAFRCGLIQDLGLDLDLLAEALRPCPVADQWSYLELRDLEDRLRRDAPLVESASIDCVVSNCVLNLVRPEDKPRLFAEVFRVLKRGGRAVISDIVADEDVPADLQADPALWSGCIGGAPREDAFLAAFEDAGFHGIRLAGRQEAPWRTVRGIEFRPVTVVAFKGKQGPCLERKQALIYRGPFKAVEDDDGQTFPRGRRIAVCDKTFHLLQAAPYEGQFLAVEPLDPVPLDQAPPVDGRRTPRRPPRETKGIDYDATNPPEATPGGDCCGTGECC